MMVLRMIAIIYANDIKIMILESKSIGFLIQA